MQYLVRHLTRFNYTSPVSESVMELRMQPLNDERQRCLRFDVVTAPRARVFAYRDHIGNAVHYFDIPGHHTRLDITAETVVDLAPTGTLPDALPLDAWKAIDAMADGEAMDWLGPSRFAHETPALTQFADAIGLGGRDLDPLTTLRELNQRLCEEFAYEPRTTRVDSPIDEALEARAGVCQDFAHIMTALCRRLGIPCRYVSGYLAPADPDKHHDRSSEHATHAWVEALLPDLGWVGFDPTNNTLARERHIVVAFGRDYGDVPPTRGVFKGEGGSELGVAVSVMRAEVPVTPQELVPSVSMITQVRSAQAREAENFYQQQQQQQQCRMIGR